MSRQIRVCHRDEVPLVGRATEGQSGTGHMEDVPYIDSNISVMM